jgi:hypothetical protein
MNAGTVAAAEPSTRPFRMKRRRENMVGSFDMVHSFGDAWKKRIVGSGSEIEGGSD